jgi:hypothetical protein
MSTTTFIISADRIEYPPETNRERRKRLDFMLKGAGIATVPVTGSYDGVPEDSLMVLPNGLAAGTVRSMLIQAAENWEQESLLEFNRGGDAWLVFTRGRPDKYIGKLVISDTLPKGVSAFTILPYGRFIYTKEEEV